MLFVVMFTECKDVQTKLHTWQSHDLVGNLLL